MADLSRTAFIFSQPCARTVHSGSTGWKLPNRKDNKRLKTSREVHVVVVGYLQPCGWSGINSVCFL